MANPGNQEFQKVVERVIEVMFVGMPVARLQMGESVKRAPQTTRHMNPLVFINAEAPQRSSNDRDDPLDRFFKLDVTRTGVSVGGGVQTGVSAHYLPPSPTDGYHCILA